MLFNSYEFMFLFLPIVFFGYFFLTSKRLIVGAKAWLVLGSLFFYSWWNIIYLPLILSSILFNYAIGTHLSKEKSYFGLSKKKILILGIVANVALLGYFKYSDFFITNINLLTSSNIALWHTVLPLGISFFTFTQIAYLVDSYKGESKEYNLLNYGLFVTFFPHLLAGPILHHKEMMPQFDKVSNLVKNYKNIAMGLFLFSIGLFKKVVIADTFAIWAVNGFDTAVSLNFFEAWATSLSYTFQLYFDFSGYTDMALGVSLFFNIKLPINFNSPYKAKNIQDFWRRWHITLSRFLKDYIYIPLGGNRLGEFRTYANLMMTFVLGGLWHGAGWTFVFWGFLHGLALILHRFWKKLGFKMHKALAWFITFNFVNIAWIFFRAKEWSDAIKILSGMFILNKQNLNLSIYFLDKLSMWIDYPLHNLLPYTLNKPNVDEIALLYILVILPIVLFMKNSMHHVDKAITFKMIILAVITFSYSIIHSFFTSTAVFLYFNF